MARYSSPISNPEGSFDLSTAQGRLEYLNALLPTVPSTAKVKILELVGELAGQMGAGVGPPPPRTDEEVVERLGVLMEGVGQVLTLRAYEAIFGEPLAPSPTKRAPSKLPREGGDETPLTAVQKKVQALWNEK